MPRLKWGSRRTPTEIGSRPTPATVPSLGNGITQSISSDDYVALLESMRQPTVPDPGHEFHVGWDGVRTRVAMLPWCPPDLAGTVNAELPIPDDGYRSEAAEYCCLARALNTATDTFRIVEIGAGWAPWAVAGIVQGRRRGLRSSGIAVEADAVRAGWALQHAADNDVSARLVTGSCDEIAQQVLAPREAELLVVQAAAWHTQQTLQFPDLDERDMGGAVWTFEGTDVDYRGAHLRHHRVPAVALATLLQSEELTDLLHVDLQGVEFDVLEPCSDVVQQNVRLMAIGTTDRLIEGMLQNHFLPRGWGLAIDEPCTAVFTMTHPTLAGFTVQDGTQLWENPFVMPELGYVR